MRVLGVLRWQRTLDEVVQPLVKRPLHRLDAEVRTVLRMGLFETVHLGVPAPVATDEMIRLTRRLGKGFASGLVNAVLRRYLREQAALDAEVINLKQGRDAAEERARTDLGMIGPQETFYQVVPVVQNTETTY